MEKKMETTIVGYIGFRYGRRLSNNQRCGLRFLVDM